MELKEFLIEAIKERFKADTTLRAIEKRIREIAEERTFEKYKSEILINDEMEFELVGVRTQFYTHYLKNELDKIRIRLAFFCKSKLPKNKREHLEKVKEKYKKEQWLEYNNYKFPIWKELDYYVKVEDVLSGNINLLIE
jgi:uncharacterized protein YbcC (UPF0753/DUF2309 family)